MALRFCMLSVVGGGEVAVNPASVSAARADGTNTVVTYAGGEVTVRGSLPEVILKILESERTVERKSVAEREFA